jgi:Fe-S cluster assembly protein SufD
MMAVNSPAAAPVEGHDRGEQDEVAHYLAHHAEVSASLPGQDVPWLRQIRMEAMGQFAQMGFPTPREEHWRYTRLNALTKRRYQVPGEQCVGLDEDDVARFFLSDLDGPRLVYLNGQFAPQLSRLGRPIDGVQVSSLARVLKAPPEGLRDELGCHLDIANHPLVALNTAFLADGAYIRVARSVSLDDPIQLVYLSTDQGGDVFTHPRNLIVAESGSQLSVVETYASLGDGGYFTNAVTEILIGENASVEHYKLQEESLKANHISTLQVHQERYGRFTSHAASFGGQLVRQDIDATLADEGASCVLNGLYMVDGRQHVDFHTTVDHLKPHGTSREFYKGILDGRSRGVFNGRVHVHPGAQKTDSEQANKNLLLSKDAEVDTKPELEIYADDVKCSHGATVGQLDPDMLFYLRARGIDEAAARGLLTYGFAQDVIDRMAIAPVRERLERILVTRVPEAERVQALV